MLAKLARVLPEDGSDVFFEPKWDGFRCLAFVTPSGEVDLRSRNDRPFARYFPEVVDALSAIRGVVLDGELVVTRDGAHDFPALLSRLHPAATRAALLAEETPATYVAFDVLAIGDDDLRDSPFAERRARLEVLLAAPPRHVALSPVSRRRSDAEAWLDAAGHGIDGVMVKDSRQPYAAGKRTMVKVKPDRTADCVVAGFRWRGDNGGVSSLLLGLHDDDGALHHVGITGSMGKALRDEITETVLPLVVDLEGHPWEQGFALEGGPTGRLKGAAGRWAPGMTQDWIPVAPVLVCEVAYDQLDGHRFRHPSRFRHWRPDRDATSCRIDQLRD
jgi:ATP-dependent DNA ligase